MPDLSIKQWIYMNRRGFVSLISVNLFIIFSLIYMILASKILSASADITFLHEIRIQKDLDNIGAEQISDRFKIEKLLLIDLI